MTPVLTPSGSHHNTVGKRVLSILLECFLYVKKDSYYPIPVDERATNHEIFTKYIDIGRKGPGQDYYWAVGMFELSRMHGLPRSQYFVKYSATFLTLLQVMN